MSSDVLEVGGATLGGMWATVGEVVPRLHHRLPLNQRLQHEEAATNTGG